MIQNPHSLFMVSMVLTVSGWPLLPSAHSPCTVVLSLGKEPTNLAYIVSRNNLEVTIRNREHQEPGVCWLVLPLPPGVTTDAEPTHMYELTNIGSILLAILLKGPRRLCPP